MNFFTTLFIIIDMANVFHRFHYKGKRLPCQQPNFPYLFQNRLANFLENRRHD